VCTRGVDAGHVGSDLKAIAAGLAAVRQCTVVITGKEDIVADAHRAYIVRNGVDMMSHVVGTGCMAASVIGAFVGATPGDMASAAAAGLCCFEIAAELAAKKVLGPASFKQYLLDYCFALTKDDVVSMQKVGE